MYHRRLLLICVIIGGIVFTGGALAADGFSIEAEPTVSVPEQTVNSPQSDATFTISAVKVISPGESLTVDATAPNETSYFVFFRNDQGDVVIRTDRLDVPQTVTVNTSAEEPGSYVLTVGPDSTPKDIIPVVIEAYQISSLETDATEDGDEFTTTTTASPNVSVELTQQAEKPIKTVNLTVWNEAEGVVEAVSLTANQSADSAYHYQGSLPQLDAGEYNVQVRVQGGDEVDERFPLIALSETRTLTVTEPEGDDSTDESGSGNGTDGSDEQSQSGDETGNNTDPTTDNGSDPGAGSNGTNTENGSQPVTNGTTDGTENGTQTDNTDESESGANGTDETGDGVINPNSPGAEPETNSSVPLSVIPNLLAVVLIVATIRRVRAE